MKKIPRSLTFAFLTVFFLHGIAAAEQGIDKEEIRALLGETQMIEGNYPEATRYYREVLKKEPSNFKVRTQLADVLSWQKLYAEALLEYQQALAFRPGDHDIKQKMAAVHLWQKDYNKAEALYDELFMRDPGNAELKVPLAEARLRLGRTREAASLLNEVLAGDPANRDAKVLLADLHGEEKNFREAARLYREILAVRDDRTVRTKLGDVLSWDRDYDAALKVYDELLTAGEDKEIRLQKARVLGWARKYREAEKEYEKILSSGEEERVRAELEAKRFYWRHRVKRAIAAYEALVAEAPQNVEARFDLSQIFAYEGMWREAIDQYRKILTDFAGHFRAQEGLEKAQLVAGHPLLASGYEFFRARSGARDVDIRKNVMSHRLQVPISMRSELELGYELTRRAFLDRRDLTEHQARLGWNYRRNPDWDAGAFFNLVTYHKGIAPVYEFGGRFAFRTWDIGRMTFSQAQQRLENNSAVIEERLFRNDFKLRQDLDLTKRLSAGGDYTFSYLSDHNRCHEVAADILYFLTLEPKAFSLGYRYAFRNFLKRRDDYFSPQEYSLHTLSLRWKHFLNKEEIFFGANDIFYEAGYDLAFDSTGITSHRISGGFGRDVTKRLQVKGEGQYTHGSSRIYEDAGAKATVKYFFG
ncbi:MAG: tetratricopeptide repeat protein [Candidatus Omnitrophica bacterium]|nr:tetratricopeptide repeat protein [Candidatus Omnitrophota bacterium]